MRNVYAIIDSADQNAVNSSPILRMPTFVKNSQGTKRNLHQQNKYFSSQIKRNGNHDISIMTSLRSLATPNHKEHKGDSRPRDLQARGKGGNTGLF